MIGGGGKGGEQLGNKGKKKSVGGGDAQCPHVAPGFVRSPMGW